MNIPAKLQRFADFMAAHSSPESCVAGRFYRVPCISHSKLKNYRFSWGKWIPLIGSLHQDIEYVGFEPWHIHVDTRFLTLSGNGCYSESLALGRVVTLSGPSGWKGLYDERYLDIADNAVLELCRLQCRRPVPPVFPQAEWAGALRRAHAGCRIVGGLCPHRGIPIACGRHVAPGVRQCPGHGLAWDDDGRNARMVEPATAEQEPPRPRGSPLMATAVVGSKAAHSQALQPPQWPPT